MAVSDISDLSSAPSDDENPFTAPPNGGISKFLVRGKPSTPTSAARAPAQQKKRPASPPHEYVLADNPDIAFIVMFASRFHTVLPKSLPSFSPQDLERGVASSPPSELLENILCALLGLVLNRKKYVERKHYHRVLEEAIHSHASQWPRAWEGKNPLRAGKTFADMNAAERLRLIKSIIIWSLASSEAVQAFLKESYRQVRHEDDLNQPLSVQPWGQDGEKRRYWLIEGRDDTEFRLYREAKVKSANPTWWSVASTIDELRSLGERLKEEGSQAGKRLSEKIDLAIPRLEMAQEKRRRREYRLARKAQLARPEPGFSLYEGRTRGKRVKYTYSSDEDDEEEEEDKDDGGGDYDDQSSSAAGSGQRRTQRSSRQLSGVSTPATDGTDGGGGGPVYTARGRQVRSTRQGGAAIYGQTTRSGQRRTTTAEGNEAVAAGDEVATKTAPSPPVTRSRRSGLRGQAEQQVAGTVGDSAGAGGASGARTVKQSSITNGSGGKGGKHIPGYNAIDEMDDEDEVASSSSSSDADNGNDGGDRDYAEDGGDEDDDDDDESAADNDAEDDDDDAGFGANAGDDDEEDEQPVRAHRGSRMVKLKYAKPPAAAMPAKPAGAIAPRRTAIMARAAPSVPGARAANGADSAPSEVERHSPAAAAAAAAVAVADSASPSPATPPAANGQAGESSAGLESASPSNQITSRNADGAEGADGTDGMDGTDGTDKLRPADSTTVTAAVASAASTAPTTATATATTTTTATDAATVGNDGSESAL